MLSAEFCSPSIHSSLHPFILFPVQFGNMLHLHSASSQRWLLQVSESLPEMLIDHAHCEQKAASTAMDLMFDYVSHDELCDCMSEIVREELEHFALVRGLLKRRGIRFVGLRPGTYGRQLKALVRGQEPQRAVDRLIIAALIEARSCERFQLLRDHLADPELQDFYGSLFESEARHHSTYLRLTQLFASACVVNARLEELAGREAEIIAAGCALPRIHS